MSLIDRCKQIDIVDFARNNGMAVVNKGRDYRLEDHDSFVFDRRKQRFYWNSQNISGDIIELAKLFFIDKEIQDPKQQFKAATDFILKNEDKKEGRYLRREFSYSKFQQTMVLPENAEKEKIEAKVENGVLNIIIPKMSEEAAKKAEKIIEIK